MPKPITTGSKPAAPAKDSAKRAYEVVSSLAHNKVEYAPGEDVELTAAEAAPLLGHTVRAKPGPKAKAEGGDGGKPGGDGGDGGKPGGEGGQGGSGS